MSGTTSVAFVTGHTFGCRALRGLLSSEEYASGGFQIPLILGLPSALAGQTVGYQSPEAIAREISSEFISAHDGTLLSYADSIRVHGIDYLLVVGWSRLVSDEILALCESNIGEGAGGIGMHPTLLPQGRGRAPIPWTILNGLQRSGLSAFVLEEGADSGAIIAQYPIDIESGETSASLFRRIAGLHYRAGRELATPITSGVWSPKSQDESVASYWPKRSPRDAEIVSSMSLGQVQRLLRAQCAPYPSAFVRTPDGEIWYPRTVAPIVGDFVESGLRHVVIELADGPVALSE
jgi:methionyl-tRNA formyltransferase